MGQKKSSTGQKSVKTRPAQIKKKQSIESRKAKCWPKFFLSLYKSPKMPSSTDHRHWSSKTDLVSSSRTNKSDLKNKTKKTKQKTDLPCTTRQRLEQDPISQLGKVDKKNKKNIVARNTLKRMVYWRDIKKEN